MARGDLDRARIVIVFRPLPPVLHAQPGKLKSEKEGRDRETENAIIKCKIHLAHFHVGNTRVDANEPIVLGEVELGCAQFISVGFEKGFISRISLASPG